MLIKKVTRQDLENALEEVNQLYDGNVKFNELRYSDREKGFRLTLRANDSKLEPAKRSDHSGRRTNSVSYVAHGQFFDALPPAARIVTTRNGERITVSPGDPW